MGTRLLRQHRCLEGELSKLGITILMVEHHMDLVMAISDHVILDYGIKIAEGTPSAGCLDRGAKG